MVINKAPKNNRKNTNANRAMEKRAHAPPSLVYIHAGELLQAINTME